MCQNEQSAALLSTFDFGHTLQYAPSAGTVSEIVQQLRSKKGTLVADKVSHDVEIRAWLKDTLRHLPVEKDIKVLLPENWQPMRAQ